MPLFFSNTRRKENASSPESEQLKPWKSNVTLDRPQTSAGPMLGDWNKKDRMSRFPFTAKWSSLAAARSTQTLVAGPPVVCEDLGIGVALGSPSESQPPVQPFNEVLASPSACSTLEQTYVQPAAPRSQAVQQVEQEETAKVKRWKTMSGLFTKKKPAAHVTTISDGVSIAANTAQSTPPSRLEEVRRRSIAFRRSRKSQAPSIPTINSKYTADSRSNITIQAPGETQAHESEELPKGPSLDIDIPNAGLDRYSIMFSQLLEPGCPDTSRPRQSLLSRRNGVESLTIMSPGLSKPRSTSTLGQDSAAARPITQIYPTRTFSLVPQGPQWRQSAIPCPLFAEKHHQLKHSHSAIGLVSSSETPKTALQPTVISESSPKSNYPLTPRLAFSAPDTPPESPFVDPDDLYYYSRRSSTASSTSTSQMCPPSPSSSTYSCGYNYFLARAAKSMIASPPAPVSRFSIQRAGESTSPINEVMPEAQIPVQNTTFLTLPPATSPSMPCTPWDLSKAFPSPLYPSASPSPRLRFGYDAPQSPLIAVAKTVTVCVQAGQGKAQRAQFVMHERDSRVRSAMFVEPEC